MVLPSANGFRTVTPRSLSSVVARASRAGEGGGKRRGRPGRRLVRFRRRHGRQPIARGHRDGQISEADLAKLYGRYLPLYEPFRRRVLCFEPDPLRVPRGARGLNRRMMRGVGLHHNFARLFAAAGAAGHLRQ